MQTDARDESTVCSEETVSTLAEEDEELRELDTTSQAESHPLNIVDGGKDEEEEGEGPGNEESPVCMSRTACGDFHNLACDTVGQAYSLPSPITFSSFPGGAQQRVVDVACGKEHCMLLTEHGQVFYFKYFDFYFKFQEKIVRNQCIIRTIMVITYSTLSLVRFILGVVAVEVNWDMGP